MCCVRVLAVRGSSWSLLVRTVLQAIQPCQMSDNSQSRSSDALRGAQYTTQVHNSCFEGDPEATVSRQPDYERHRV